MKGQLSRRAGLQIDFLAIRLGKTPALRLLQPTPERPRQMPVARAPASCNPRRSRWSASGSKLIARVDESPDCVSEIGHAGNGKTRVAWAGRSHLGDVLALAEICNRPATHQSSLADKNISEGPLLMT